VQPICREQSPPLSDRAAPAADGKPREHLVACHFR
jgi:hypothetical protein